MGVTTPDGAIDSNVMMIYVIVGVVVVIMIVLLLSPTLFIVILYLKRTRVKKVKTNCMHVQPVMNS